MYKKKQIVLEPEKRFEEAKIGGSRTARIGDQPIRVARRVATPAKLRGEK
jgi:hypothetical protein